MLGLRLRALALWPLVAATLATAAHASIANPVSGTPINLSLGASFTIKLKNAGGCTFDYSAEAMDPGIVEIAPFTDSDVKGASIKLTGLQVGTTMVSIQSSGGTCPPATHSYPVTVTPDYGQVGKDFDAICKLGAKDYKLAFKAEFGSFKSAVKDLAVSYKLGALSDDQLQDGFQLAGTTLRANLQLAGALAYTDVLGTGTQLFLDNGVTGQAPSEFFAGGGGGFDDFQNSVCGQGVKFHDLFQKAETSAVSSFLKAGAPRLAQWNVLPPVFGSGPLYPAEAAVFMAPQPLTGPFTITLRPTTNLARDNGRLLVSGNASSVAKPPLHVVLTHDELGQPTITRDNVVPVVGDGYATEFLNLKEGSWKLFVFREDDNAKIELPLNVYSQD